MVYSSINIVHRPPITQANGNLACATTSTEFCDDGIPCSWKIYLNIKPYWLKYWPDEDLVSLHGGGSKTIHTETTTVFELETPFVYQPEWKKPSDSAYPAPIVTLPGLISDPYPKPTIKTNQDEDNSHSGDEKYGYIPQAFIDYLSTLDGSSFQSVAFLPGGPMAANNILFRRTYFVMHGDSAGGLTEPSEQMVNAAGCFHPETCPETNEPAAGPAQINPSPHEVKIQATDNQGSQATSPGASRASRVEDDSAPPQASRLQGSPIEQSNGGMSAQPLPPELSPASTTLVENLNGAWLGRKSPSRPDPDPSSQAPNRDRQGQKPSSQSGSNLKAPTKTFNGAVSDRQFSHQPGSNSASTALNIGNNKQGLNPITTAETSEAPGGTPVSVAGASFTLAPSGLAVGISGVTTALPALPAPDAVPSPAVASADNGRIMIANVPGQLSFGFPVLSLNDGFITVASIPGHSAAAVVNGVKVPFKPSSSDVISTASPGHIIPELVTDGQTALPGRAPIIASGVPISLSPFGHEIIVRSSTETVSSESTLIFTIGSQTIVVTTKNGYVIGDQTLTPSATATNVGISTSSGPEGSEVVTQKTTTNVFDAAPTNRSSLKNFAGDTANGLLGLKTMTAILIVSLSLGFSF